MQGESLVLLEKVLRELERQHASLLRQLAQFLLTLVVEKSTAAHEAVIAVVEKHLLLGCQFAMMLVYVLDALEESLVELHVVGVLRENGAHLLRQFVQFVASFGAEHARESGGNS